MSVDISFPESVVVIMLLYPPPCITGGYLKIKFSVHDQEELLTGSSAVSIPELASWSSMLRLSSMGSYFLFAWANVVCDASGVSIVVVLLVGHVLPFLAVGLLVCEDEAPFSVSVRWPLLFPSSLFSHSHLHTPPIQSSDRPSLTCCRQR